MREPSLRRAETEHSNKNAPKRAFFALLNSNGV